MVQVQQLGLAVGEDGHVASSGGGRTVVVGVKLDSHSRELLTWALVKVTQPSDTVIALHVLGNDEIVDREGKSSLLSLVKAFDSVLAVYEGFCNLKQVDLKLKICRGTSIRKILVREAYSYLASTVIVGTSRNHHTIRSSTSVAKYCAKKLSKDCSVLAVSNGKVVFRKEVSPSTTGNSEGNADHQRAGLLNTIQQTISLRKNSGEAKNSKVVTNNAVPKSVHDQGSILNLERALMKTSSEYLVSAIKKNCSICGPAKVLPDYSCNQCEEKSSADGGESLAIVPVRKVEAASTSITMLIRQLPEVRPGWPLLRHSKLRDKQAPDRSPLRKISVVQWALRLPTRQPSYIANLDIKQISYGQTDNESLNLDGESGAVVSVGNGNVSSPPSPDQIATQLPQELEGLHEKYSAICRLFKYQELLSATSGFLVDNLIGKGGSSQVYKGCLPDGKELAVKILKSSEDVLKEIILEIKIITILHHKKIISLWVSI